MRGGGKLAACRVQEGSVLEHELEYSGRIHLTRRNCIRWMRRVDHLLRSAMSIAWRSV